MKKIAGLPLTVIALLVIASVVFAAASAPGTGWWSGEQIQNVGAGSANVEIKAYDSASPSTYLANKTIASGGSATFLPADFTGMPSGFQGSAVVSSTEEIRAIVNVTNRLAGSYGVAGGLAAAQYQGMNQGDSTLNFPLAKNDYYGKTTTFYIQNAGNTAATAAVTFKMGGSSYNYPTPSIGPGQMVSFSPVDASAPTGLNGLGSMTVTSAQPLAGSVLEHKTSENPATLLQATRGFTSTDSDTTVYAPIIKNSFYNRFTGLQVQNTGGSAINITVTYKSPIPGCSVTDSATNVPAGASHTFVHLPGLTNLPISCLASAKVVGTGPVVAIVNESYLSSYVASGHSQESTTYSAAPDSSKTVKLSAPLYKENSYNKGTGLQVQNVGSSNATNVVLAFSGPTGTYTTNSQTIAAGSSLTFVNVRNKPASFWNGTAMTPAALGCTASGCGSNGVFGVTITADQPVVAIANESTYPFTAPLISQDKNNYEGFNLTP